VQLDNKQQCNIEWACFRTYCIWLSPSQTG